MSGELLAHLEGLAGAAIPGHEWLLELPVDAVVDVGGCRMRHLGRGRFAGERAPGVLEGAVGGGAAHAAWRPTYEVELLPSVDWRPVARTSAARFTRGLAQAIAGAQRLALSPQDLDRIDAKDEEHVMRAAGAGLRA